MYIMCSECTLLDRSHKEHDKSTSCYRYTCKNKSKHWWINKDSDLKKISCGNGSKEIQNGKNKIEQLKLF